MFPPSSDLQSRFKKEETEKISHDDDKRILKIPAKLKSKKRGKLSFYKYLKIQGGNVFLSLEFLIFEMEFLVLYMYRISLNFILREISNLETYTFDEFQLLWVIN